MKMLFAVGGIALLTNFGCLLATATPPEPVTTEMDSARQLTIAANGVGDFVIGTSTLAEILGHDTPAARQLFAELGLSFQFDRGVTLTGVTVGSADYRLANGLAVGASADAVRKSLGEPKQTKIKTPKFSLDAMVYDDFTFVLADDVVSAIFVGGSERQQRPARAAIELQDNLLRKPLSDWPGETRNVNKQIQQFLLVKLGISSTGKVLHVATYRLTETCDFGQQGDQVFHFVQKDLSDSRLFWSCLVNVDSELTTVLYDLSDAKRELRIDSLPPLKASTAPANPRSQR